VWAGRWAMHGQCMTVNAQHNAQCRLGTMHDVPFATLNACKCTCMHCRLVLCTCSLQCL
jgi:hypothetical protein